jgi:hypothetical protein
MDIVMEKFAHFLRGAIHPSSPGAACIVWCQYRDHRDMMMRFRCARRHPVELALA